MNPNPNRSWRTRAPLATLTCLIAALACARAGVTVQPAPGKNPVKNPVETTAPAGPWDITMAAGFALTDGNSDTITLSLQALASYVTPTDELYLGVDYLFGETEGETVTHSVRAFGQYNRMLSERAYAGLLAEYLWDEPAQIDYRIKLLPTAGYYLIKTDTTKLAFEIGAGYIWEDQGGTNDYFALRFGERFTHQLSATSKLWQSVAFEPEAGDWDNYLLTAELGIETRLTDHWALRAWVRDTYDNTPAPGAESNDLAVLAGLSYSLGGFPPEAPPGRRTLKPDKAAPPKIEMGWRNVAAVGFSLTDGNSDTLLVNADFDLSYLGDSNEFFFRAGGAYGEVDGNENVANARAALQHNWLFGDRYYAGAGVQYYYDDIAEVDYRVSPAALVGVYLLKNDRVKLSIDAGPSYVFERVGGVDDDFFALQFGERLEWAVCNRVTLGQAVTFSTEAGDWNNWLVTASAFLDTEISSNLSWRISVTDIYDNTPAAGREENDLTLTTGIAIRF